jgi:hypothetical protein
MRLLADAPHNEGNVSIRHAKPAHDPDAYAAVYHLPFCTPGMTGMSCGQRRKHRADDASGMWCNIDLQP